MSAPYIPDDLFAIIDQIVSERIKHLRTYRGIVQSIVDPLTGVCRVHCLDYGTEINDPQSWLDCYPGAQMRNRVFARVGDVVDVFFPEGFTGSPAYYRNHNPLEYFSDTEPQATGNAPPGVDVIYESGSACILFDPATSTFTFKVGATVATFGPGGLQTADPVATGPLSVTGAADVSGLVSGDSADFATDVSISGKSQIGHTHIDSQGGATTPQT